MFALLTLDVARDAVADQFTYGEPLSTVVRAEEHAPRAPAHPVAAVRRPAPRRRPARAGRLQPCPLTPRSEARVTRGHAAAGTGYPGGVARVTLQTIADQVGVSRMTVSNAFSRPDQLSASMRRDDPRRRQEARVRRSRPRRAQPGPGHHQRHRHRAHVLAALRVRRRHRHRLPRHHRRRAGTHRPGDHPAVLGDRGRRDPGPGRPDGRRDRLLLRPGHDRGRLADPAQPADGLRRPGAHQGRHLDQRRRPRGRPGGRAAPRRPRAHPGRRDDRCPRRRPRLRGRPGRRRRGVEVRLPRAAAGLPRRAHPRRHHPRRAPAAQQRRHRGPRRRRSSCSAAPTGRPRCCASPT